MTTVAADRSTSSFEPVAAGSYVAVCDQVIDLGLQPGGQFDPKQKIYLRFQVPSERVRWKDKEGKERDGPMVIGRTFTLSLSEKSYLRPFLESWRGRAFTAEELRGFDITNVAGVPALISVIHEKSQDGRTFARIASAMGLPKGTPKPVHEGPLLCYDCDHPDAEVFAQLSKFIRGKIENRMTAEEVIHHMANTPEPELAPVDDDIPF